MSARSQLIYAASEGSDSEDDPDELITKSVHSIRWSGLNLATRSGERSRIMIRQEVKELTSCYDAMAIGRAEWEAWRRQVAKWTPAEFIQVLVGLASVRREGRAIPFLNSLAREIPEDLLGELPNLPKEHEKVSTSELEFIRNTLAPKEFVDNRYVYPWQPVSVHWMQIFRTPEAVGDMPENLSMNSTFGTTFSKRLSTIMSGSGHTIARAQIAYTPATQLFGATRTEKAMMVRALAHAGADSHVFATPLGNAILVDAYHRDLHSFYGDLACDIIMIVLLFVACFYIRREVSPHLITITLLSLLSMRIMFNVMIQGIMAFAPPGGTGGHHSDGFVALLRMLFSLNGVMLLTDLFCSGVILYLFWNLVEEGSSSMLGGRRACSELHKHVAICSMLKHSNFVAFMILMRWTHMVVHLLGSRTVGQNVLPAIHAASRPESLFFMLFITIIVFGAFHAYYSFPIAENVSQDTTLLSADVWNKILTTYLKVYRLTVMGDFDLFELEGVDDSISATIEGKTITGEVDEGEPGEMFQGIRLFFFLVSVGIHLVLMNVYIGLVSMLYEEAKAEKKQLYFHFLANQAYQYLMRRLFWDWVFCSSCGDEPQDLAENVWLVMEDMSVHEEDMLGEQARQEDARMAKLDRKIDELQQGQRRLEDNLKELTQSLKGGLAARIR